MWKTIHFEVAYKADDIVRSTHNCKHVLTDPIMISWIQNEELQSANNYDLFEAITMSHPDSIMKLIEPHTQQFMARAEFNGWVDVSADIICEGDVVSNVQFYSSWDHPDIKGKNFGFQ